ncbi:hypothetical protein [Kitasatospora sp. NPDC059327]|uniref:hypothetical protein n=1 Tax=Kitasatospora sp. NPDC059327 TaxID=3346803 RepID=UPI00369204A8
MQQPDTRPATTPAPTKPTPGTYVLFRDADRLLAGRPDHTQICRVLPLGNSHDRVALMVLATKEIIHQAPVAYMRPIDPAELMHDIDTAPLDALGEGRLMTAAGAWLALQHQRTNTSPGALPATRD